ncbi:MAG: polysaccharide deacetylase family protein [Polyangiaceae bacterium]|nr:polysaccharide deacetylase family protein [Polyangiaceae bacterium]
MSNAKLRSLLKSPLVKRGLYRSGLLDHFHHQRNRQTLTVVVFHRVIAPSDPRFSTCDPEYTLSTPIFEECLRFFCRHYNPVSMAELLDAADGLGRLPERALHVTFDDGWSDNEEFGLESLSRAGLPATLFVVSDAVDRAEPFWQERLVGAWRRGMLSTEQCRRLWHGAGGADGELELGTDRGTLEPLRAIISRLQLLDEETRGSLLAELGAALDDGVRHMVSGDQLRAMVGATFTIGSHGKTHTPLLLTADPEDELRVSRSALASRLGQPPVALSFPHGSFSPQLVGAAHRTGYRLVFTSSPELASTVGRLARCLPRIGITADGVTDDRGAFAPEKTALLLFRKPISFPAC